jgi:hypothetical protein
VEHSEPHLLPIGWDPAANNRLDLKGRSTAQAVAGAGMYQSVNVEANCLGAPGAQVVPIAMIAARIPSLRIRAEPWTTSAYVTAFALDVFVSSTECLDVLRNRSSQDAPLLADPSGFGDSLYS